MLVIKKRVGVSDTDLTGAMYFTNLFRLAQESFEEVLGKEYPHVLSLFLAQKIAMPVVFSKASFVRPLFAGDELEVQVDLEFGNTSFSTTANFYNKGELKGKVEIKHVCVDLATKEKVSSKDLFHELLVF